MAIAGIVLVHSPQSQEALLETLGGMAPISALSPVNPEKLAVSLELPSAELTTFLKKLATLPLVQDLELVFVNYEDDLDDEGHIAVPPEAGKYE